MDQTHFARPMQGFASFTGRRDAVRSLGALGMALLAALGLTDDASAASRRPQARNGTVGTDKKKRKKCAKSCSRGTPTAPVVRVGNNAFGPGFLSSTARCNPGEYAVGGGFHLFNADLVGVVQMADIPLEDDDGVPIGWSVNIENSDANKSITARVLCVAD